ncbi:ROK family protein [Rhizobium binae]|uniref:ROK family protein n=1 Tax=Rhizobium binae TaxID=1138190 RepID=UPI003DA9DD9F
MQDSSSRQNNSLSRRRHRYLVLEYMRRNEQATPSQVSSDLDISLPTVTRVLADLVDEEFIEYVGRETTSVGRPASVVRFRSEEHAIVSLYAHMSGIYGMVTDLSGRIVEEINAPTVGKGSENTAKLLQVTQTLLSNARSYAKTIRGISVAVQSMVRRPSGTVVLTGASLDWRSHELGTIMQEAFEEPTLVESDHVLGVLGEWTYGRFPHVDILVRLSIGPGTSAGLMINGNIYRGSTDAAGELKWFADNPRLGGPNLPLLGDMNSLRFGEGLPQKAFAALEDANTRYVAGEVGLEDFEYGLAREDGFDIVRELFHYATAAAASSSALLNPSAIILSGQITRGGSLVVDILNDRLGGDVFVTPKIALSKLGLKAVMLGGVKAVLDSTTLQPPIPTEQGGVPTFSAAANAW